MSEDIAKIFGQKLYKLRKSKKLTQESLGFEVDLDKSTIGKYENGLRYPSIVIAKKIATALGVKLSSMLD